jgi:hypothetical protein
VKTRKKSPFRETQSAAVPFLKVPFFQGFSSASVETLPFTGFSLT